MINNEKRKIAVFTGNRSEFSILAPILKEIDKNPGLDYYLIVSGAHLDEDFGESVSQIKKDGFRIYKELKLRKICELTSIEADFKKLFVNMNTPIKEVMKTIDENQWSIAFVLDNTRRFKGTVTDGDIRRTILSDGNLSDSVSTIMNKDPFFVRSYWEDSKINKLLNSEKIKEKMSLTGTIVFPVLNENDSIVDIVRANNDCLFRTNNEIAEIISEMSSVLLNLSPDLFLAYGDRYETFAAVICATQMIFPTVHVEGGDITLGGALDDSIRHAITKLAHIHLTTNEDAHRRIISLGEEPWRVHNVGFPILDLVKEGDFAKKTDLEKKYGIDLSKPFVVFLQHSVTTEIQNTYSQIQSSLDALEELAKEGINVFVIFPNNDAGGMIIIQKINELNNKNIPNIKCFKNFNRYDFHGLLNVCGNTGIGALVGNSSSGIKEAPSFHCPIVNIGTRQKGRLRAENIIDVDYDKEEIIKAIKKSLLDKVFRDKCKKGKNPYESDNSSKKVTNLLASVELNSNLIKKKITF